MKKFLIIFCFALSILYSQEENRSQSIELPDFVITGKESITLPKIQKSSPDFIPLLSKDFFTPEYPNEDQTKVDLPKVETEVLNIGNYSQTTHALLRFSAGLETWPLGEFFYNDWSGNFSYNAHLFGKNELEYVDKAGLSLAGADIGAKYFVDHSSDFLPGLEIGFNGNYFYESFNFYGSATPKINRITNNGFAGLDFNYVSDPFTNFGINFSNSYYQQKDDEIDENIFGTNAYFKLRISDFDFKIEGNFKNQTISALNQNFGNQYYYSSMATLGFKLYDILNLKGGIYLSESEGNTFFAPVAYGSLKFNKSISLYGEFAPNTEFKTLRDFRNLNRYYQLNNFVNLFIENKFNLKAAAKFEYEKYFEISGGVGYINSDNNFYFEDNLQNGFFTIHPEDIEKSYAFINLLFRKGPFGQFYGEIKLQNVSGQNDKYLPYSSTLESQMNYSYDFIGGFGLKLGLLYFGEAYTNYDNTEKIPQSLDFNLSMYYELFRNFNLTLAFENLLNDKYYYFRNYEAKPFDVLAGFEFRW
ncbi:MAG: hypothetical protein KDC88_13500 [Ignavibacteriae bacterium]|nr:hypothetical protein [Ignavibacteriota bacterium]